MFIAALFTEAKTWKQPKCPLTDKWLKKMWYVYTMEYYSAKKNEIMLFVAIQMNLETVTLRRVSQTESDLERELSYDTAYRQNPNDTNELT